MSRSKQKLPGRPPKQPFPAKSQRQTAFFLFDMGQRPSEVVRMIKLKPKTAYRYFQQWKKLPPILETKLKLTKRFMRKLSYDERMRVATILAYELDSSAEEVLVQMQKPWAIRQLVTGEWREWPVVRVRRRPKSIVSKAIQRLQLTGYSIEVKHILEMATRQSLGPQ